MRSTPRFSTPCASVLLALTLTGCAVSVPAPDTALDLPAQWQSSTALTLPAAQPSTADWWRQFQDPLLDRWIADVLARNQNLALASLNTQRARLQAGISRDAMFPTLSGSASSNLSRPLDSGEDSRQSSARLGLSYEWDLWGRLSSRDEAARWEAQATEQEREAVRQSLVVTTATLYWQAGLLNQRIAAGQANLANARRTLEIVTVQWQAGAASALDLAEIRRNLANLESTQAQLLQERDNNLRALSLLRDAPPSTDLPVPEALPELALPTLDAGLPAQLLARRPDVQAAEMRLRKSLANAAATRADYYPQISLTGALGTSSNALLNLLSNPVATLGAGLSLPFLQFNQQRLNRELADTDTEQAVIQFRQALYQALAEVEDALSAQQRYDIETEQRAIALAAAQRSEALQQVRYEAGAIDLKTLLDAQDARRNSEVSRWEALLNQRINRLQLWQALGGPPAEASEA